MVINILNNEHWWGRLTDMGLKCHLEQIAILL